MSVRLPFLLLASAVLASGCAHDTYVYSGTDVQVVSDDNGSVKDTEVFVADAPIVDGYPEPVAPPPVLAESAYGGGVVRADFAAFGEPAAVPRDIVGQHDIGEGIGSYLLDTGDQLRIFVYGQPNLSRLYVVDQAGMIAVPLIGQVSARGKTTVALQGLIRSRLGAQYVRDPQVTVDIQQNRPFFIYGEVRTAGQYPYVSGMTIETAIAIAGGFTERANDRKFRIKRRINGFVEQIEAPNDYLVRPGDTVYVAERFF